MSLYLVVDDNLEKIQDFGDMGRYIFVNQKELNTSVMSNRKYRNHPSIAYTESYEQNAGLIEFISIYRKYAEGKMVIEFPDKIGDTFLWTTKHDELQKRFDKIKNELAIRSLVVNSLRYYLDIALRRVLIKEYYVRNIVPKISKAALLLNDKSPVTDFHIKYSGWGYIAAFKPKILLEFSDSPCFWIKLIYSKESLDLVEQNLTKNKDTKIFIGNPKESIRYIDIFTNDASTAHLLNIIAKDEVKAINVNLVPLIEELKKQELFYCIANWSKN